ncbi:MAG TPA: secretin N-terminal domain-containing protein [Longimicrobiaceae bacterium]|nr:secretin N-terminal domain-containing protein [Longimicrobiaceae bacterium]
MTLNFQDADLRVVVASLAQLAGLTVSYSGLPSRKVTLRSAAPVRRSQLRSMLESVLSQQGLSLVEEGGLARVVSAAPPEKAPAPPRPAPEERQVETSDGVHLYIYRLRHSRAEHVAETLRSLFGIASKDGDGRSSGTRRVGGAPHYRLANPLAAPAPAQPSGTPESPAPGGAAVSALPAELHGSVQIVPDPLTNTLLIRSDADDYQILQAAIGELDIRPLQVLIEVLIAEVRHDHEFDLGATLDVPDQQEKRSGATIGGSLTGSSAGDVALHILGVGSVKADVILHALASTSSVKILSRPIVLAQNNQEARIMVGTQRPFIQISRSLPTEDAVRDQVVQYRDVGTSLTITPTVNPDGYVTLELKQEVSGATTETQFGAPVISTRELETQLFLKDGHTAVIGGLMDQQREDVNGGIPVLRSLPLIGSLFRSTQQRHSTTELFLLLTPHVIRTDEEMDDASGQLQERSKAIHHEIEHNGPMIEHTAPVKRREERW